MAKLRPVTIELTPEPADETARLEQLALLRSNLLERLDALRAREAALVRERTEVAPAALIGGDGAATKRLAAIRNELVETASQAEETGIAITAIDGQLAQAEKSKIEAKRKAALVRAAEGAAEYVAIADRIDDLLRQLGEEAAALYRAARTVESAGREAGAPVTAFAHMFREGRLSDAVFASGGSDLAVLLGVPRLKPIPGCKAIGASGRRSLAGLLDARQAKTGEAA